MPEPVAAHFRYYAELNDFLPGARRGREFSASCAADASVKHVVESHGVPHTEVELILVNGDPVDFAHRPRPGDRISVYPKFEAFDVRPLLRLRPEPLRQTRFIADAHLGGLARLLRMAGLDTLFSNRYADAEIVAIAGQDGRIILSRDRELLKRREVSHGCYVHALDPEAQFREMITRLDLANSLRPFALCLECNLPLAGAAPAEVADLLPPRVRERCAHFSRCPGCRRVYWEGSHWRRMRERLAGLLAPLPATLPPPTPVG